MAISPVAAAVYANQVAPAASAIEGSQQARIDMQNAMASALANAKNKEVEEVRPTEETYKIDPENEHEKRGNSGGYGENSKQKEEEVQNEHPSIEEIDNALEKLRQNGGEEEEPIFNFSV